MSLSARYIFFAIIRKSEVKIIVGIFFLVVVYYADILLSGHEVPFFSINLFEYSVFPLYNLEAEFSRFMSFHKICVKLVLTPLEVFMLPLCFPCIVCM